MMLVTAFLTVFAMPIVTVALTMVWWDRNLLVELLQRVSGR